MKLSTVTLFVAALLSAYNIVRLPYTVGICFFIVFAAFAYIGYVRKLNLLNYAAFFGFIILSAIMSGYYADVKGVGGTIMPELILGGIGMVIIILEELKITSR